MLYHDLKILRSLMSDGPITEERIVSGYLDYLALACVFGFVETLAVGKWLVSLGDARRILGVPHHWNQVASNQGKRGSTV